MPIEPGTRITTKLYVGQGPAGSGAPSAWRSGAIVPSDSLGLNGDYYLRTTTGDVFFKSANTYSIVANIKGPPGETGPIGQTGASGPAGSTWRNGTTVPSNSLGINGDYFLNTTNSIVYVKSGGSYSAIASLLGQTGSQGPEGPEGPEGPAGAIGPQGPPGISWTIAEMTEPGTAPQAATIIIADIPMSIDSEDCAAVFATENYSAGFECEGINNACQWVDPAYQCTSANGTSQIQCEAVNGCNWEPKYCEDLTDQSSCEEKSECSWDTENGSCSGGLYSNECNGEPVQTGCFGTFGTGSPIPQINFLLQHQTQAKTLVVANKHGTDSLYLQLNGSAYFAAIPSGKAALLTFNDGAFERLGEWI